jgi:DNA-binding NarL/FixJ family response regulator
MLRSDFFYKKLAIFRETEFTLEPKQTVIRRNEANMKSLSVLLVNSSPKIIQSAARYLSMLPQIGIVSIAPSGTAAMRLMEVLELDLVLLDLRLPDMSGLELTTTIKKLVESPKVILLGEYDFSEYHNAAAAALADGFICESELGTQFVPMIEKIFYF